MISALRLVGIAAGTSVFIAAAALAIAAWLLPAERSFTNELDIDAPAEKVWQVLTDKERYTEWQTQLEKVEIVDDANWVEYPVGAPEPLRFRLVSDERPHRMRFGYKMGDSMHGHWEGEVKPQGNGVRLTTVDGYRTEGIMTKLLMATFFDMDAFAKDWNNKLKRRVETLR